MIKRAQFCNFFPFSLTCSSGCFNLRKWLRWWCRRHQQFSNSVIQSKSELVDVSPFLRQHHYWYSDWPEPRVHRRSGRHAQDSGQPGPRSKLELVQKMVKCRPTRILSGLHCEKAVKEAKVAEETILSAKNSPKDKSKKTRKTSKLTRSGDQKITTSEKPCLTCCRFSICD